MKKNYPIILLTLLTFLIGNSPTSQATTSNDETFAQTVRMFYWLIMGFPSEAKYNSVLATAGDEAKELIPDKGGMAGHLEDIRSQVATLIVSKYPSITKCSQAPTSGTTTLSDTESVEFKEASVTPPSSFPVTSKYEKRAVYTKTVSTTKKYVIDFQWTCDKPVMYAKFDRYVSDVKVQSYVIFYDRSVDGNGHVQFYLTDSNGAISGGGTMLLALHLNILSDNKFKLWVTRSGVKDNTCQSYRTIAHGNYSTGQTSLMYQDIASSGYSRSAITASTTLSSIFADKTASGGYSAGSHPSNDSKVQVCVSNFDQDYRTSTDSTLCSGMDLSEAPVMGVDKDGDMSLQWVHDSMATKINAL